MTKKGTTMTKPLRDLLLIELDQPEEQNNGIFISKSWQDAITSATVLAVGKEVKDIKKGERIHINPYAYIDLTGTEHKLIKEGDVLGYV